MGASGALYKKKKSVKCSDQPPTQADLQVTEGKPFAGGGHANVGQCGDQIVAVAGIRVQPR